jgi:hypothetical protein
LDISIVTTLIIWWAGIFVELAILLRGIGSRAISRFPFFYTYIACVACCDICLYLLYAISPATYAIWSARAELLNLVLGYSIILEIFRHVFPRYAGAERFARTAGLFVFGLIFAFAIIYPSLTSGTPAPAFRKLIVERDFLTVQAIFLFGILGIIYYYGLELGRNVRGIIVGYGIWLGTSVITLELRSYIGASFDAVWIFAQPACYLLSLLIWLAALWNYAPVLDSESGIRVELDYERLVSVTRGIVGEMRAHLGRAARP